MNDLRSRNRTLAPVRSIGPRTGEIVSAPPKPRPKGNPLFQSSRPAVVPEPEPTEVAAEDDDSPLTFKVSRDLRSMPVTATSPDDDLHRAEAEELRAVAAGTTDGHRDDESDDDEDGRAPASRPSRRREVHDDPVGSDDKFPWHHHFNENEPEPEELQAKSPLLSRAFRSSVG